MEFNQFTNLIKEKKQTIVVIMVVFALFSMLITFAQPLKYRASTRLLVVQEGSIGSDAYSISRSNKYLSSTLSEVVYSNTFLEQVLASNFKIDDSIFSKYLNKRMKQWKQMVSAGAVSDTGIIVINTYHPDRHQASEINQAIAYTLKNKHEDYHGLGKKVSVRVLDRTILSNWPVKPNILLNLFFGVFFGFLVGLSFVRVFPNKAIKIFPLKKQHQTNNLESQAGYLAGGVIGDYYEETNEESENDFYSQRDELVSEAESAEEEIDLPIDSENVKENLPYVQSEDNLESETLYGADKDSEGGNPDKLKGDINNLF